MRLAAYSLFLAAFAAPASAADLSKIERTIAKEPAYKGTPKYCLLVFGADAKYRVWVVLDDEFVYVDRNGTGDLTAKDQRWPRPRNRSAIVKVGDVVFDNGKVRYTNLVVSPGWGKIEVGGRYPQRAGHDAQGELTFANRPQDAPIVHFGGPWQFDLFDYCFDRPGRLVRGSKPGAFAVSVGTPGLGKGTFAYLLPPAQFAKPVAEFAFTHRDPKEKPLVVSTPLTGIDSDCTGFSASVRVPDEAAGTKAKVTLSFADWKDGAVAPRTFEISIDEPKPLAKPK